jgi:hypothetical protein
VSEGKKLQQLGVSLRMVQLLKTILPSYSYLNIQGRMGLKSKGPSFFRRTALCFLCVVQKNYFVSTTIFFVAVKSAVSKV